MLALRRLSLPVVLAVASAAPAVAGGACEHVMTSKRVGACLTSQYFICENGERRERMFRGDDEQGVMVTDADLNLISFPPLGGNSEGLGTAMSPVLATHRAFSLEELLRMGQSTGSYDLPYYYDTAMMGGLEWEAELTGQQVAASGVTFQVARFRVTFEDPNPFFAHLPAEPEDWQILIDPERRLMVVGPSGVSDPPVIDIILPGEPGFEEHSYDCPTE